MCNHECVKSPSLFNNRDVLSLTILRNLKMLWRTPEKSSSAVFFPKKVAFWPLLPSLFVLTSNQSKLIILYQVVRNSGSISFPAAFPGICRAVEMHLP